MAHLVRQHGGDFRGVVGKGEQAAGDIEITARQRKGVDRRRIQDGDAVGLARIFRHRRQRAGDAGNEAFGLGILVFAAVACHDARMLTGAHRRARVVLLHLVDDLRIGRRRNTRLIGLVDQRLTAIQRHCEG